MSRFERVLGADDFALEEGGQCGMIFREALCGQLACLSCKVDFYFLSPSHSIAGRPAV